MQILIEQEVALHQYEIRQNRHEIARLIHPSFKEVGKSGTSFDYADILEMMGNEKPCLGHIHSQDFETIQLEPSIQLLLYKTAWIDKLGTKGHYAKRSSIWVFTGEGWQLKYHQGTPCAEFELVT
ncbi:nuclear transport factor 2 family protein [Vibrio sp. 16]|uniref:nuclear transport factor 2 family protein n=1 Tax=Vibrio sp. 16 TaxID=391586 RepID=UPI002FF0E29D